MLYKEKILILHRNSLIQERIAAYLREHSFAVILANSADSAFNLTKSMKPDIILWGESLTAQAKEIIRKIKNTRSGSTIPVIAMIPDVELFDRIEIEKIGINDIIETQPNFTDLKLKIRFHLNNRKQLKKDQDEIQRLQDISELQYNLIRVQDVNRLCELVNDYIQNALQPDVLITLVYNKKTNEYDFKSIISANGLNSESRTNLFGMPIWQKYFLSNPHLEAERIVDAYFLEFFGTVGLQSQIYYQFPIKAANHLLGLVIIGLGGSSEMPKRQFAELEILINSLAHRIINTRSLFSRKPQGREEATEIQYLFQQLNEDEISNYLSQQLLNNLKADVCIYFNYNEGFRFLYPQYCYKSDSNRNFFDDEKPPVLLLKDFPTFEQFIESNQLSAYYNLQHSSTPDLMKMASLAGGEYPSLIIFTVKVGNEIKGFFLAGNHNSMKRFTTTEIQNAEQFIHKATNMIVESRIVRQAQKTIKQLDRVFELGKEFTLDIEINDLLKKIATAIRRTLGWNVVILNKKNMYTDQEENVCVYGLKANEFKELLQKFPGSMFQLLRKRSFEISNSFFYDHQNDDEHIDEMDQRRFLLSLGKEWNDEDWIFVPIQSRGRELGYIIVNDPVERLRPNEEKVRSLEYFANQAAVALENAVLYENLKLSEGKYRLLAETMTMGLVTCDFSGKINYVNQSLAEMLQYKQSDSLLDQNILELCAAKDRGDFENHVLHLLKKPEESLKDQIKAGIEGIEIDLLANDNNYVPLKIFLTTYYERSNKAGFLGVLSDLRPQRKLERLKADFNSMIVHDLRSPLNIIQGYIDIVRNQVVGNISPEQGELLYIAKENVDKVLKLIENFMLASKIEAGKFDINFEIQSINALIEAVYEQHLVLTKNKNIEMNIDLDSNISFQQFDKLRIEQVISNYLSNAIKFTKQGGKITIKSRLVKEVNKLSGEETMAAFVAVKDTGIGIPYEEQSKVFNKYEQTEAGKDASLKGTGLGLAICKEIISLHKGRVWLESEPGKGSIFYFSLPIIPIKL